jgi:SprT protein
MIDYVKQALIKTRECLRQAESFYGRPFLLSEVKFNLLGQTAGMLQIRGRQTVFTIRINRVLLESNPVHILGQTVPHEVAHLVAFQQFGFAIKPHGVEWQEVMQSVFNLEPTRCHDMDTSKTAKAQFIYMCACAKELLVTKRMHSKLQKSQFRCKICSHKIAFHEERKNDAYKPPAASRLLISSVGAPLTKQHISKVKELLAGAEVGQAILHAQSVVSGVQKGLSKTLDIGSDKIIVHESQSSIPDNLTHAVFFFDTPTDRQVLAIERLRLTGARVRILKHPRALTGQV